MSSQKVSAKAQKTSDATIVNSDGPIEDDKTAREKLREAGFDPDDVHTARSDLENFGVCGWYNITPMTHFASYGDLPMIRYLYHVRGASTTTVAKEYRTELDKPVVWYPIVSAAYGYNFDTFKWLYQNGAKSEVLEVREGRSAISKCFCASADFSLNEGAVGLAKWLVLEGVLEEGSDAKPAARRLHHFLYELQRENIGENRLWELKDMPTVFIGWMKDLLGPNVLFHNFLLGTLPDPQYSVGAMKKMLGKRIGSDEAASMLVDDVVSSGRSREIWDQLMADAGRATSSNSCLASLPGVLEKIGDYVGIIKSNKLKRVADAKDIVQRVIELQRSSRRHL